MSPGGRSGGVEHRRFDEGGASPQREAQHRDRGNWSGDGSVVTQGEHGPRQPGACHRCIHPAHDRRKGGADPSPVVGFDCAEQRFDIECHDRRQEANGSVCAGELDHLVNELADLAVRAGE